MRTRVGGIALSAMGVVWVLVMGGGCNTAGYRGASPSARTLSESPREIRDYYVGMNFNFSLDRSSDYRYGVSPDNAAVPVEPTEPPQAQTSVAPQSGE